MIPDGDRRQCTESGDIINEPHSAGMMQHDIVRVFVLNHHIFDHLDGRLSQSPMHDILERLLGGKHVFDIRTKVRWSRNTPFDASTRFYGAGRHR